MEKVILILVSDLLPQKDLNLISLLSPQEKGAPAEDT